ncbi:MAG TPA: hypothetical protein VGA13_13645 [Acidimicrobiales bacterium]
MSSATPADDTFHEPADPDIFWTETSWFGFNVPELRLAGAVYPVFRPNQGVCSAGVYVWDDHGVSQHEIRYARNWWHLPMPDHDLTQLELPIGLSYETVEPLTKYRVRFDDGEELELDLTYQALHEPHAPMVGPTGHLDQACRVTGHLVLHGERIEVDGFDMRDRSWSVRKDQGQVRAGYDYGIAEPDGAFLAMSMGGGESQLVLAGFRLVDGDMRKITGGHRTVEREHSYPVSIRLELTDETGDEFEVLGQPRNRFAFQSSPSYFAWMSLTEWTSGAATSWGQSQDVWSPDLLREELRRPRAGA